MVRWRQLFSAALLCMACAPVTAGTSRSPEYGDLARSIETAVTSDGLPSAVVVVFDHQHILWSRVAGYADPELKTAPSLQTRYRVGSMAKAVTSTVLVIAAQRQLIAFNSQVKVATADGIASIPVDDLVNMRAGLAQAVCYDGITGAADADCGADFDARFGLAITAGAHRYSYSNMGPQLAADALAASLREPFERIARRLLFTPAGMHGATYSHARTAATGAKPYDRNGAPYVHDFRIAPAAGAGLEASAADLIRFGQLHLSGRAADGRRLLSHRMLARLHSAPNDGFYGYGWGRIGAGKATELLISDGQVNGGQAMLLINPARKVGALVLSNAANDKVNELALSAIDTVAPGTSTAFAADVEKAQAAHGARVAAFLPPPRFAAAGFVRVGSQQLPIEVSAHAGAITVTMARNSSERAVSEEDEGFRGWPMPCLRQIPACAHPGATAKLWLSRDVGGLGGQLQVTSLSGQLPYAVRLRFH